MFANTFKKMIQKFIWKNKQPNNIKEYFAKEENGQQSTKIRTHYKII